MIFIEKYFWNIIDLFQKLSFLLRKNVYEYILFQEMKGEII
jgi:hypothetical protein